jgi:hypothetical protein
MPSIELKEVLLTLPKLTTLRLDNIDFLTKDMCIAVLNHLNTYIGLETLSLEFLSCDLEEV